MGIPEREESEQRDWEPIWRNNDRKLAQSGKGKRQRRSGSSEIPKAVRPKRLTLRHIINKMTRLKDKERILTPAREK